MANVVKHYRTIRARLRRALIVAVLWPVFNIVFRSLGGSRPQNPPGLGAAASQPGGSGGREPLRELNFLIFSWPKAWYVILGYAFISFAVPEAGPEGSAAIRE